MFGGIAQRIEPGDGRVAARFIDVADDAGAAALLDQAHALPDEGDGAEGIVLEDAPAQCVIAHVDALGDLARSVGVSRGVHGPEAAVLVPLEALDGMTGDAFFDKAVMRVVEETPVAEHAHEIVMNIGAGVRPRGGSARQSGIDAIARGVIGHDLVNGGRQGCESRRERRCLRSLWQMLQGRAARAGDAATGIVCVVSAPEQAVA